MGKAQMNLVPVYIMAGILFILVLAFGYNYISGLEETGQEISYIGFQQELKKDVETMKTAFGSSKQFSYTIPEGVDKVCFYDPYVENPLKVDECPDRKSSLAATFIKDDPGKNVFLVGNTIKGSFQIDGISVGCSDYVCFDASNRQLRVKLEGTGKKAVVKDV